MFEGGKNTSETGKLAADLANGTKFQYNVKVSLDGEEVDTSELATVEVVDSSAIVAEVTEISYINDKTGTPSTTLATGDTGTIKVLGKTKGMDADDKPVDIAHLATITTSKASVVKVDAEGNVTPGIANGTATITVEVGEESKTFEFTKVADSREIDADKSKVASTDIEATSGNVEIEVSLVDNFGEPVADITQFKVGANDYKVSEEKVSYDNETNTYTIKADQIVADATDVSVKVGETEIGKVNVKILTAGEAESFKLKAAKTEIDLKELADQDEGTKAQVTVSFVGVDEKGLEVTDPSKLPTVKFATNDPTTLDVNADTGVVTAKKEGEAKVYAYLAEDGFKTPIEGAELTINVVNNTPKISGVTFGEDLKITSTEAITGNLELSKIIEKISVGNGTATVANDGTITFTDKDQAVYTLGTVSAVANSVTAEVSGGKVVVTSADNVGKDTVEVDILDLQGNLTGYSTTIDVDLVTKADKAFSDFETGVNQLSTVKVTGENATITVTEAGTTNFVNFFPTFLNSIRDKGATHVQVGNVEPLKLSTLEGDVSDSSKLKPITDELEKVIGDDTLDKDTTLAELIAAAPNGFDVTVTVDGHEKVYTVKFVSAE